MAQTLSEKVWEQHVVHRATGEPDLLYIDLHLVHEVTSPQAFDGLRLNGRGVRRPELTVATMDHNVPTIGLEHGITDPISRKQIETLAANCAEFGIRLYGMGDPGQGIVHVIGPEQGLTQPGMTIVCGDSHTSTHGAFGALAFGIGTSEVEHVLATQTLPQQRPGTMAVTVEGDLPAGVTAKDVVLSIIAQIGTGGGIGSVIEYRGSAIRALSMEGRMTVCNMSIEAGARAGLIAPDDTTFAYLEGRPFAPKGAAWEQALDLRRAPTDPGGFDKEVVIDRPRCRACRGAPTGADDDHRRWSRILPFSSEEAGVGDPLQHMASRPGRRSATMSTLRSLVRAQLTSRRPSAAAAVAGPNCEAGPGHGRSGLFAVKRRRGRGAQRGLHRRGIRVARARLLDVPRDEPGQAGAGRTRREHEQPQFRGSAGQGRAHPPGVPRRGRRHRDRRALRRADRPGLRSRGMNSRACCRRHPRRGPSGPATKSPRAGK
jgi:hypothetical protein